MSDEEVIEIGDSSKLPTSPVVSVLMIAYNHEKYISQAINSVLAQKTSFQFELVIGEDCSIDGTRRIIEECQQKHPEKIRVIYSEKNVGVNKNFARTYASCRGEYLAICEGDDYWQGDDKLERQYSCLNSNKEAVLSYHDAIVISDDNDKVLALSKLSKLGALKCDYSAKQLSHAPFLPTLTLFFRNNLGPLPREFYRVVNADTFLISILGLHGGAVFQGDLTPAVYREHQGGIWSSQEHNVKLFRLIETYYWLSVYYNRCAKPKLTSVFRYKVIRLIINSGGLLVVDVIRSFMLLAKSMINFRL